MKQSYFTDEKELFPGSDIVRRYSFKAMRLGDSYALLAVILPNPAVFFGLLRVKYALFQKKDCFECLSPTENAV